MLISGLNILRSSSISRNMVIWPSTTAEPRKPRGVSAVLSMSTVSSTVSTTCDIRIPTGKPGDFGMMTYSSPGETGMGRTGR